MVYTRLEPSFYHEALLTKALGRPGDALPRCRWQRVSQLGMVCTLSGWRTVKAMSQLQTEMAFVNPFAARQCSEGRAERERLILCT